MERLNLKKTKYMMVYAVRGLFNSDVYLAEKKYIDDEALGYIFDGDYKLETSVLQKRLELLSASYIPKISQEKVYYMDARYQLQNIQVLLPFSVRLYIRDPDIKNVFIPSDPFSNQEIPNEAYNAHNSTNRDFMYIGDREIWYATEEMLKNFDKNNNISTNIYCPKQNRIEPDVSACKKYYDTIASINTDYTIDYEITNIKLQLSPTVVPSQSLHLMSIFHEMSLSETIPYMSFETPFKQYYKLYKDAYGIHGISHDTISLWLHEESISHSTIKVKVRVRQEHYGTCTIDENGKCSVYLHKTDTKNISETEYTTFLENVHMFLQSIEDIASPKIAFDYPKTNEDTIKWLYVKTNIHFDSVMEKSKKAHNIISNSYNNILYRFDETSSYDSYGVYDIKNSIISMKHLLEQKHINSNTNLQEKYLMKNIYLPEYNPDETSYSFMILPNVYVYTYPNVLYLSIKQFTSWHHIELISYLMAHIYTKGNDKKGKNQKTKPTLGEGLGSSEEEDTIDDTLLSEVVEGGSRPSVGSASENTRSKNIFLPMLKNLDKDNRAEDEKIFTNSNYTITCQGIDSHPVPISDAKKEEIDKNHPDSYTVSKQHELYPGVHFICPEYWCPISKVSIGPNESCPLEDEQPIHKSNTRRNYPSLRSIKSKTGKPLASNIAPCCKIKDSDKTAPVIEDSPRYVIDETSPRSDREFVKNRLSVSDKPKHTQKTNYIPNYPNSLGTFNEPFRLPLSIDEVFEQRANNEPRFIMYGVEAKNEVSFLNSAKFLLRHNTKLEFSKFSSFEFLCFGNGSIVQSYSDTSRDIYDDDQWNEFSQWYNDESNEYVLRFQLDRIKDKVNRKYIDEEVRRDFMIYRSYKQFQKMILDDSIMKNHQELYDVILFNKRANPYKNIFLILDGDTEYDNRVGIHCPLYYSPTLVLNPSAKVHMILKHTTYSGHTLYNPIVWESRFSSQHKIYQFLKFNTTQPEHEEYNDTVATLFYNFMGGCCQTASYHPQIIENIIKAYYTSDVKDIVVSYSFTCVGLRLESNCIIPYPVDIPLASFVDTKHSFTYLCDALKEKMTISLEKYQKMLHTVQNSLYQINNENNDKKDDESLQRLYTVEKNYEKGFIQTQTGMYVASIQDNLPYECHDDITFLIDENVVFPKSSHDIYTWKQRERKTFDAAYQTARNIENNDTMLRIYNVAKDPLNPYSFEQRKQRISNALLPDTIDTSCVDKDLFASLLISNPLNNIYKNNPSLESTNDIIFDDTDVEYGRIDRFIRSKKNPYKTYETTENSWIIASPNKKYSAYIPKYLPEIIITTQEQSLSPNIIHNRWFRNKFMALIHDDGSLFSVHDCIILFEYAESYIRAKSSSKELIRDFVYNTLNNQDLPLQQGPSVRLRSAPPQDTKDIRNTSVNSSMYSLLDSIASKSIITMISKHLQIPVILIGRRLGKEEKNAPIQLYGNVLSHRRPSPSVDSVLDFMRMHFLIFNYIYDESIQRGYVLPVVIKGTKRLLYTLDDIRLLNQKIYDDIVDTIFDS